MMFIFAMTLFPEEQEKAQKEIDIVVGRNRLPEFSDRDLLPYLEAVMQEVLR
jgi:cytochrome P450